MRYLFIDERDEFAFKLARDYERDDLNSGRSSGRDNPVLAEHEDGRRWLVWHSPSKDQITVKRLPNPTPPRTPDTP